MIETERLILRPWCDEDLEPFAKMNADPRVMEFFPSVKSFDESLKDYTKFREIFEKNGWGFWAATLKENGAFIGFIGLSQIRFETSFTPAVEIGWRLAFEHWGKGYATEGAKAAIKYGFENLQLEEIVSFTAVDNLRSRQVMHKLGMHHESDFEHPLLPAGHKLRPHVLYRKRKESHIIFLTDKPPENFKPHVEVASCYIEIDGKILLMKRAATSPEGNTWGVPAGKIEKGESPLEGAVRELFEETGIKVSSNQLEKIGVLYVRKAKCDFAYHMYQTKVDQAPDVILSPEHTQYQWVNNEEVKSLPLISGAREALDLFWSAFQR
jgi:RimJ/RimL family protein N-acetyltransferase/8-oxo-dGTP pyrophosphatase MutT (NUDIX family)